MIQIYRIEDNKEIKYFSCCYDCAKKFKEQGKQITYDMYCSERYPSERKNDTCDVCEGDFNVDGRKIKKGELKSTWDSFN